MKATQVHVFLWTSRPSLALLLIMQYGTPILRHRAGKKTTSWKETECFITEGEQLFILSVGLGCGNCSVLKSSFLLFSIDSGEEIHTSSQGPSLSWIKRQLRTCISTPLVVNKFWCVYLSQNTLSPQIQFWPQLKLHRQALPCTTEYAYLYGVHIMGNHYKLRLLVLHQSCDSVNTWKASQKCLF